MNPKKLIQELKRRNVFKVATAYIIAGWLIIQVISTIAPQLHLPEWVPAFFTILVLTGFPIAIILAWAFELTPDGVKRTDEVPQDKSVTKETGNKLNIILTVLLLFAVAGLFYQYFSSGKLVETKQSSSLKTTADSASAPAKSIAVLPFENLSTDSANAYFADGMQDMILTKLADIGDLKVISRTSTERYKSHPGDLKTIAAQLGVATILEGSVQKAGDQVLINVQLINARSDNHIWADSYTRTLNNIFGVEGEVAQKIASALNAKLSPAESKAVARVPTRNPAAYDAYLHGLTLETSTSATSQNTLESAASAYERAVKLDPDFALAWAHLSSIQSNIYFSYFDFSKARLARAKTALDQALSLAPDAAATQLALGNYEQMNLTKALAAYRKALQSAPNSSVALADIGQTERHLNQWFTSIDYMNHALTLDPRNVSTMLQLSWGYWGLRRYAQATQVLQQARAISPGDPFAAAELAEVYQSEGQLKRAGNVLAKAKISPDDWISFFVVVEQKMLTRQYPVAVHLLQGALQTSDLPLLARGVFYQMLGFTQKLAGNFHAAQAAYSQAIMVLGKANIKQPNNPIVLAMLAYAQTGIDKIKALATARLFVSLRPADRFPENWRIQQQELAEIESLVGEKAQAISLIKHLMDSPGCVGYLLMPVTPALLRLNPVWDPLRNDPGFQTLLKKYPWKQEKDR